MDVNVKNAYPQSKRSVAMSNRKKDSLYLAVPVLVVAAMLVAGCEEASNQAITVAWTPAPLGYEYSVPVQLSNGTMTTISQIGKPFYVIAFVETPADDPCYVSPEVQRIAQRLWLDSVSVIQISLPTSDKRFDKNVLAVCTPPSANLFRIFDQDRRAWNKFNRPKSGTLLLVNTHGNVTSRGTLSHADDVVFDAERLASSRNEVWTTDVDFRTY